MEDYVIYEINGIFDDRPSRISIEDFANSSKTNHLPSAGEGVVNISSFSNTFSFINSYLIPNCLKKDVLTKSIPVFSCVQSHLKSLKENTLITPEFMVESYAGAESIIQKTVVNKIGEIYNKTLETCMSGQVREIMADKDAQKCFESQHINNTVLKKEKVYMNCSVHFNTAKLEDPSNYKTDISLGGVDSPHKDLGDRSVSGKTPEDATSTQAIRSDETKAILE